jgi:hypothetical protein
VLSTGSSTSKKPLQLSDSGGKRSLSSSPTPFVGEQVTTFRFGWGVEEETGCLGCCPVNRGCFVGF